MAKKMSDNMTNLYSDKYIVEIEKDGKVEAVSCLKAYVRQRKVSHLDRLMGRSFYDKIKQMSFCSIENDLSTPVILRVTPQFEFKNYNVRPFSGKIQRKNNSLEIEITCPTKISVEFDGDIYENLFVFVDRPKQFKFSPTDDNVIYFTKGAHDVGELRLTDGQTLYLESGAYVYGSVISENAKNVKICGHGIICGEKYEHNPRLPRIDEIRFINCENVRIEDITILDSPRWTICFDCCKNVSVTNVKEICNAFNSDGIDITACENVIVSDCFFRGFDDSVSVKARHEKGRNLVEKPNPGELEIDSYFGNAKNVLVENCVFWPDAAHPMLVGPEAEPSAESVFENIVFKDITVLQHKEFSEAYQGVMAIFCADNATVKDITFKNIYVDRMDCGRLISIIYTTEYASTIGKQIKNIRFENVAFNGEHVYTNRIQGHDETHTVESVTIKDLVILNRKQTEISELFGLTPFVNGLNIE